MSYMPGTREPHGNSRCYCSHHLNDSKGQEEKLYWPRWTPARPAPGWLGGTCVHPSRGSEVWAKVAEEPEKGLALAQRSGHHHKEVVGSHTGTWEPKSSSENSIPIPHQLARPQWEVLVSHQE